MFPDIYIYPINNKTDHFSEKYIFLSKNWYFPDFFGRIHIKMKRIRNTAFLGTFYI